jgi:hypothetical protein
MDAEKEQIEGDEGIDNGFHAPATGYSEAGETSQEVTQSAETVESLTAPEQNGRNFINSLKEKFPKLNDEVKTAITAGILSGLMTVAGVGMMFGAGIDKGITGAEAIELALSGAGFMSAGIFALSQIKKQ